MPLVGLRFSHLQVAAASLETQPSERFTLFSAEGCAPALDGKLEVLKSPLGDDAFSREYCCNVAAKQTDILNFLAELGDPQVTHYLLKWCVNGSRLNYLVRTTPLALTHDAAVQFDLAVSNACAAL